MASSSLPRRWACLRRKIAGREVPRRWAGDDSKDASARDQNRVRPQRADAGLPSAALREAGAILLLDRARRRRTACPSRSDYPQVSWCGKHPFRRYLHIRGACEVLQPIIEKVWRTCEGAEIRGRTVTLKVKYADFQQITRSRTGQALFSTRAEIEQLSYALLEPMFPVTKGK